MNRKPVLVRNARTVLTEKSAAFQEKLLCDGLTLNLGDACAFSCSFCYVGSQMWKLDKPLIDAYNDRTKRSGANGDELDFHQVVIRRKELAFRQGGWLLPFLTPFMLS